MSVTTHNVRIETQPRIDVPEAEYVRLLGYPRHHELSGRARELADRARDWYARNGSPWVISRRTDDIVIGPDAFTIDGARFTSDYVRRAFSEAGAHAAELVAVSAGPECEAHARALWQDEKPDEYFFLEVYGSAVVEHLIATTGAGFCARAESEGEAVLPHYSPGYPDWDIAEQHTLLDLLRPAFPSQKITGVNALETGMLSPKKSLLAVFGVTSHVDRVALLTDLVPCSGCPMVACQFRRAPYSYSPNRGGEVGRLQSWSMRNVNGNGDGNGSGNGSGNRKSAVRRGATLNHAAPYSISLKALRKWSNERLRLSIEGDRSIHAHFALEGTTCSNQGYPIHFEYDVVLDPPEKGYRIVDAHCGPAADDDGFELMCEYLREPDDLERRIETEAPLLGKSIDDVFEWDRKFSPTGCYCEADSRAHKWGLVLEVIHYALVQLENDNPPSNLVTATP